MGSERIKATLSDDFHSMITNQLENWLTCPLVASPLVIGGF